MDESMKLVMVSLDEYAELYENAVNLSIFKKMILETSSLSYNKKHLNYDDEIISAVLKIMDRDGYEMRMRELKEEFDGTDNNV